MSKFESKIKRGKEVVQEIQDIRKLKSSKNLSSRDSVEATIALSLLYIEKDAIEEDLQKAPLGTVDLNECLSFMSEV